MTDASATPAHHYRLRTFGTVALVGPKDATVLGRHGHQRHRLALLAVLAAAGEEGRNRDQLLLLFWPDANQQKARHSLEQLLYAIRSSIDESVFAGVNPVRLNRDVITSDVGEFHAALERGDLEAAAEAYRAPFLDGFYLGDAPEFEQWLSSERSRLERSYSTVLERLAEKAERAHDQSTAVHWWRKLAELDAVSSRNATGLIRSLMNAGDHAAALQYAEHYEAVVQQELGTSAGPAVTKLVAEVRANADTGRIATVKSRQAMPGIAPAQGTSDTPRAKLPEAFQPESKSPGRIATYVMAGLVVVALVATAAWRRGTLFVRPSVPHSVNRDSTRNIAAYELYRRGNDPRLLRSDSGARAGLEYFSTGHRAGSHLRRRLCRPRPLA